MENKVLDIIIIFVKALKQNAVICNCNKQYKIQNSKYLLNQIIRQYEIPKNHYLISQKAKQKWKELSSEDITKYHYRNTITCENNLPIKVKMYKNNGNKYEEKILNKGDKFIYKDIFHNEHIIPIEVIIKQLIILEEQGKLNYNSVEEVLNNIYVCRMLKEEDRNITSKYKRPYNLHEAIENIYKQAGIEISTN